jgi:hypothetical protein
MSLGDLQQELAGIDQLLGEFEREDTLEGRIHVLGLAFVCLLNAERRRVLDNISFLTAAAQLRREIDAE